MGFIGYCTSHSNIKPFVTPDADGESASRAAIVCANVSGVGSDKEQDALGWFPIVIGEEPDICESRYVFFSGGCCCFEIDGCDVILCRALSGEISGPNTVNLFRKFLVEGLIGDVGSGYEDCFSILTRSHILWGSAWLVNDYI